MFASSFFKTVFKSIELTIALGPFTMAVQSGTAPTSLTVTRAIGQVPSPATAAPHK